MSKPNKSLFIIRKPLKGKSIILTILSVIMTMILLFPVYQGINPIYIIWTLFFSILFVGFLATLFWNRYVKKANAMTEKHRELKSRLKDEESTNKEIRREKKEAEDRKIEAEAYAKDLEDQNEAMKKGMQILKEIYLVSSSETVRTYAAEVLNFPYDLDLFDPILYIRDNHYARTIDANAVHLTEILQQPNEGKYMSAFNARKELNALLKKKGSGTGICAGGSARERKTLPKIEQADAIEI